MNLTLDEVKEQQGRLRQEIMERQCLLAAFDVMCGYMEHGGKVAKAVELTPLISAFAPSAPSAAAIGLPPAVPATLPAPPPVERHIHPNLAEIDSSHTHVQRVRWALERITEDFTLHDIVALLKREGYIARGSDISGVLTRMKRQRAIKEIRRSYGPQPALFRKPDIAASPAIPAVDSAAESEVSAPAVDIALSDTLA